MIFCGSQGNTRKQIIDEVGLNTDFDNDVQFIEDFGNITSNFSEVEVQMYNNLFPESRYKLKDDSTKLLKRAVVF